MFAVAVHYLRGFGAQRLRFGVLWDGGIFIKQIADFIKGLIKDQEAVENAVTSPYSNGFVEGTNSKLKMVKRTMYGRCRRQLLAVKLMLNIPR